MTFRLMISFVVAAACTPGAGAPDAVPDASDASDAHGLPIRHTWDDAAAARGQALIERGFGRGNIPALAIRSLWLVWGQGGPGTDAAYWATFRARYGVFEAPYDNGGYPMGIHAAAGDMVTLTCALCHASVVGGRPVFGTGNPALDLQALYDDLVRLNELAPSYGFPSVPIPYVLADATGAAGAIDAFGLGMRLAQAQAPHPPLAETFGYQQAPAWWTQRYRDRQYLDGGGEVGGHRTMMATLLAYGYSFAELAAMDDDFADVAAAVLATPAPPAWDLTAIDAERAARGRAVYRGACASCHGTYEGLGASYPDEITPTAELGTDPLRATRFTQAEAEWIDASWFGADHPMTATGGYLAPPLLGVWATAPYFHNGSVPDLAGVLATSERPAVWKRTGTAAADYDALRVGWRFTTPPAPADRSTATARTVVDTRVPGMANGGHAYGDALSADERADLLEYLRGL